MLLGQRLGRRHQRGLAAALHGAEHRAQGHDGLARADLAHQQPLHGPLAGQVAVDLLARPGLVAGQLERQRLRPWVDELARRLQGRGPPRLVAAAPPPGHRELEQKQLLQRQALAARAGLALVVGEVHTGQGRRAVGQALGRPQGRGQRLHYVGEPVEVLPHQLAQLSGGDPLGGRVERHLAGPGRRGDAVEGLELLDPELVAVLALAVQEHAGPLRQPARDPRLVEPHGQHRARVVGHLRLHPPAAAVAHRPGGDAAHRHRHSGAVAGAQVGHLLAGPLGVLAGQVGQQVAHGLDPERGQRLAGLARERDRLAQPAGPRQRAQLGVELQLVGAGEGGGDVQMIG